MIWSAHPIVTRETVVNDVPLHDPRAPYTGPMGARKLTESDFSGDLQAEVMSAVWRLGHARVDDVRDVQPESRRSAYTTVQTVLNRLVDRGLLTREREGQAFVYRARLNEADHLAGVIGRRLAGATPDARKTALLNVVGDLNAGELDEIARYAERIRRGRGDD